MESLKKHLIGSGWKVEDVEEVAKEFSVGKKVVEKKSFEKPVQHKTESSRPVGVVIVAILHWLIAASVIMSVIIPLIMQGTTVAGILPSFVMGFLSGMMSFIILPFSLLPFLVGLGIWRGKNGWRVVAIVFGILVMIQSVLWFVVASTIGFVLTASTFVSIINLVVAMYIVGYLLISKRGKKYFGK